MLHIGTRHRLSLLLIVLYVPSFTLIRDDPEAVEIYYSDMESLAPEAYLSSTIMNFYIR